MWRKGHPGVMVKTICVVVTEDMATDDPLLTPLMLLAEVPPPANRSIFTVGAVPPVSKVNPLGTCRIIVPVPALPLTLSE